jgi:hypothetical protein
MRTLKTVTTVFVGMLMWMFLLFTKGLCWKDKKDRATIVGFGLIEIVYALSLICMWA